MTSVVETPASTPTRLQLSLDVQAPATDVWRCFPDGSALEAWWPEQAEVDPTVGGTIVARWPSMTWTMRGRYTELRPSEVVEFTWSWDHEPDAPERRVRVEMAELDDSPHEAAAAGIVTRVVLTHGDYEETDEAERSGHLEGWLHFLPRLGEAVRSTE